MYLLVNNCISRIRKRFNEGNKGKKRNTFDFQKQRQECSLQHKYA